MLRKSFTYHVIPIVIAALLAVPVVYFSGAEQLPDDVKTIEGNQTKFSGFYGNLLSGDQAEIDFLASIKNKHQLTVLGSSEFSDSPFAPYNFIPDSLGIPALGLGHAYHQELSMLCELLTADAYIEGADICILISPGWFSTNGTNVEAFIEFARPHFLDNIVCNDAINVKYKMHIGELIHRDLDDIIGASNGMMRLHDLYVAKNENWYGKLKSKLRNHLLGKPAVTQPQFDIHIVDTAFTKRWSGDYHKALSTAQSDFVQAITNNKMYVYDDYYAQYILQEDGTEKHGSYEITDLGWSPEMKDFQLLVEYLAEKKVKCSFVIQPLNPYYYDGLENFKAVEKIITETLDQHNMPYLNMFVYNKKDYEPGTLKDVMHLGDYGWMKVNQFIDKTYYHE